MLVALRKESVDRNKPINEDYGCNIQSLSARRAWIEITPSLTPNILLGRSPQGERG